MNKETKPLEIKRNGTQTVLVLAGDWSRLSHIPSLEDLSTDVKKLSFDSSALTSWNSRVLVFARRVKDYCAEHNITLVLDGLPLGVQRLFDMSTAVEERKGARRTVENHGKLYALGASVLSGWQAITGTMEFVGEVTVALGKLIRGKARFRKVDFLEELNECGPKALGIVALISVLVGTILAFLGAIQLKMFGAEIYVANLVSLGMMREMGALMTAIIMTGRTGAAFAARLGTMQVNEEVDALKTLAFDSTEFLILPRMLALAIMMPVLTIYSNILGILGGALVGIGMLDITPMQYYTQTIGGMGLSSVFSGLIKSVVFGALVAICGCMNGIRCGRSASAVGTATTKAVVSGIVAVIVADSIMNIIFIILGF